MDQQRNYIYYDHTTSLCHECLRPVSAKIVFQDGKVLMKKNCPDHGFKESGKAFLLSGLLILVVGFSACFGIASLF